RIPSRCTRRWAADGRTSVRASRKWRNPRKRSEIEVSAVRALRMKVILKPVSHPGMGNIDIVDDLFAIGRNEEPFVSKLGEAASSLWRRQARVFREGDEFFLADLGSRNGTRVNKRELRRNVPTALRDNDRIVFADAVEFLVQIQRGTGTL